MQNEWRRHVVGQVRHDDRLAASEDLVVVRVEGVGVVNTHPVGGDHRRERPEQVLVNLHGVHLGPGLHQRQGERAEPRADFEHQIARSDVGEARNTSNGVGIDDEVLTEGSRWFESVLLHESDEFGAGMGHQVTLTRMTPLASGASLANSVSERSTTRSPRAASLSVTVQTIARPVARSRTVMRVP